jgi:hypothetical protein
LKWNVALELRDGHIRRDKDEGGLWSDVKSNGIMVIKVTVKSCQKQQKSWIMGMSKWSNLVIAIGSNSTMLALDDMISYLLL